MLPTIKRHNVEHLQSAMLQMPQAELPTFHYFADNMYARVVKRPAGTLIVGKIHKKEHLYIVTKGKVRVASDTGSVIYEAGDVIISKPGTKRAVFALEDSICMTVHRCEGCEKLTLAELEEKLVEKDEQSLFGPGNKLKALSCHS